MQPAIKKKKKKMKGGEGRTTNKKRERPSENLNARCQDVEPKQYSSRTW